MKKEIFAERQIWTNGIAIFVGERQSNGSMAALRPGVFEVIEENGPVSEATLRLTYSEAQKLMDEIWSLGLRPSEGSGSAGSLAATERHLKDLQDITRGILKKYGVET